MGFAEQEAENARSLDDLTLRKALDEAIRQEADTRRVHHMAAERLRAVSGEYRRRRDAEAAEVGQT